MASTRTGRIARAAALLALVALALAAGRFLPGPERALRMFEDWRRGGAERFEFPLRLDRELGTEALLRRHGAAPRPNLAERGRLERWQSNTRSRLLGETFELPGIETPEKFEVEFGVAQSLEGGVTRYPLTFRAFDSTRIPAYLFEPAGAAPTPGVVVVPGHVAPHESGLLQLATDRPSYQHGAALALARAGFVTLALELRGFGMLGTRVDTEHRLVAWNALLAGKFYKWLVVRDIKRAVDVLSRRPRVDGDRIAIAGASYGAELAVLYGALDRRIRAVAAHAHGGNASPLGPIRGSERPPPHYCHIIPGTSGWLQRGDDPFVLVAPRPLLVLRGDDERPVSAAFRRNLVTAWLTLDAPAALEIGTGDGGHEFFVEQTARFLRQHLGARAGD